MKTILAVTRESFKCGVKMLREKKLLCVAIGKQIRITNFFYKHIAGNAFKKRTIYQVILRLSILNIIPDILRNGILTETRLDVTVDTKRFFVKTYKIEYKRKNIAYYVILGEKKNEEIIIISCFVNDLKQ